MTSGVHNIPLEPPKIHYVRVTSKDGRVAELMLGALSMWKVVSVSETQKVQMSSFYIISSDRTREKKIILALCYIKDPC